MNPISLIVIAFIVVKLRRGGGGGGVDWPNLLASFPALEQSVVFNIGILPAKLTAFRVKP